MSAYRVAWCVGLTVTSFVMVILGSTDIMYRAGYLQAQRDFPAQQQCNALTR